MGFDNELVAPWIILGAFAVAGLLTYLAVKAHARDDGRGRTASRILLACAGLVASATLFFWFSRVMDSRVLIGISIAFPAAVLLLLRRRRRDQRGWLTRLAERTGGVVYEMGGWERPAFGVLPSGRHAVAATDQGGRFSHAIEFNLHDHRLLGVEYVDGAPEGVDDFGSRKPGSFQKLARLANHHTLTQLRTPSVPTLLIRPRTQMERQLAADGPDPHMMGPFEESHLSGTMAAALDPDEELVWFESGDSDFDEQFTVRTADPEFARRVLTPEVVALLKGERWFRLGPLAFQQGALWTGRYRKLGREGLFEAGRHLVQFARAVDSAVWRYQPQAPAGGPAAPPDPSAFVALLGSTEVGSESWRALEYADDQYTTLKWLAWLVVLGGALVVLSQWLPDAPVVILFCALGLAPALGAIVHRPLAARRETAGLPALSQRAVMLRMLVAVALVVPGLALVGNGSLALFGVAEHVTLAVSDVEARKCEDCEVPRFYLSGSYRLGGEVHQVDGSQWLGLARDRPQAGEAVDVAIGPVWWHPVIEGTGAAVELTVWGLVLLVGGLVLGKLMLLRRRRPKESEPTQTAR